MPTRTRPSRGGFNLIMRLDGVRSAKAKYRKMLDQVVKDTHEGLLVEAKRIQQRARQRVVTDTGGLRESIQIYKEVASGTNKQSIAVGSRLKHAKFVEFGTSQEGRRTNKYPLPKGWRYGPKHSPSSRHLAAWAGRHGMNPFLVARAIRRRPGLKARPFLYPAYLSRQKVIVPTVVNAIRTGLRKVAGGFRALKGLFKTRAHL